MSYSEEHLWGLLRQAEELPYGPARTALVEQVITEADAAGLRPLSFHARLSATNCYVYGGEPVRSFDTFSWTVAEFDRDPSAYEEVRLGLLWQFKATVTGLLTFPDRPLAQIEELLADMDRRWRAGGHSPHAVYSLRHVVARHVGDLAAAEQWYERWTSSPRDELSDCAACDPGRQVRWLTRQRRYADAVAIAAPVLDGRATCSEQPQGILTDLLKPYLCTADLDRARDAHRQAYRRLRDNPAALLEIGEHIWFCATTGNLERGLELVERHLPWLEAPSSPLAEMRFAAPAALLLRRLAAAGSGDRPVHRRDRDGQRAQSVPVSGLAEQLSARALELAARFDARNRSGHQTSVVRTRLDDQPLVGGLSLTPAVPRRRAPAARQAPEPPVPAGAGPSELLDLAEQHYRQGEFGLAYGYWHAFDDRYASAELTAQQRARRADGYALETANAGDLPPAETAWRSAIALYAEAGDELRRQIARGRLGLAYCATGRGEAGLPMVEEATTYVLAHAGPDRRAGAFMSLSAAYGATGRHEDGLAALERAEQYAAASPDPNVAIRLVIDRAQHLGATGDVDGSRETAAEGARLARAAGFPEGVARACWILGLAAEFQHDPQAAVEAYDEALQVVEDPGFAQQLRRQRATLLAGSVRAGEAIDDLLEALDADTSAGNVDGANATRHQLAIAYLNAGRVLDAAETAEEAVTAFDAAGDPHAHSVRHLLATANLRLGQPDDAIVVLEIIEAHCLSTDNPAGAGQIAEEIGDILDGLDRDAAAAARFDRAARRYRDAELPLDAVRAQRRYAASLLWSHDLPGALTALELADLASAELPPDEPSVIWERAMLGYDGAKILSRDGRLGEGALRAAAAAGRFRGLGAATEAAHAEALRGELLLQAEQPADAEQALRRALAELPEEGTEDARQRMADLLAEALIAQGQAAEAAAVRAAHGLASDASEP
jgi:tetratricopeptide (TPR) repeat protein